MTGRYPSRLGVLAPAYGRIFSPQTLTLPAALRSAGYRTSLVGKWHMGSPPDSTPLQSGFDTSYGYFHGQIDPWTHLYKTGVRSWHRNDRLIDETGHATDLITEEAVRILRAPTASPLFMIVAYSVPHHPLNEPESWTREYNGLQPESKTWYSAAVSHMDAGVGKILDAIDSSGKANNTLVVFMSDNGGQQDWISATEYGGSYADRPHTTLGNNLPLRGWKEDLYEGGIRVPAIVSWPGTLRASECSQVMHVVDWMPTLSRLTGSPTPPEVDGTDIWSSFLGSMPPTERTLYWRTPKASAVRSGEWKLILPKDGGTVELFNLNQDPYETGEMSTQEPEVTRRLLSELDRIGRKDASRSDSPGVLSTAPTSEE